MESSDISAQSSQTVDGKWIETMSDGIMLFKNISFDVKETDKQYKDEKKYEHIQENWILEFKKEDTDYDVGNKYFDPLKNSFWTVTERDMEEEKELKGIKLKYPDSEDVVDMSKDDMYRLLAKIPLKLRVLTKSGNKITIKGFTFTNSKIKTGLADVMASAGLKLGKFKIFHGKDLLKMDETWEELYASDYELNFFACESLGKPRIWNRFPEINQYGTWSNSGRYHDRIAFVPNKDITFAGFSAYSPKELTEYYMKYKVEINDVIKVEQDNFKKYSNFEDQYYWRIYLEDPFDVKANTNIKITVWCSRNLEPGDSAETWYGREGSSYQTVQNPDMGLFTIEAPGDSGNGTSTNSGQIPEIIYFL